MLEDFTADLGPKVTLDSFSSNEELISKLVAAKGTSGYDIVVPTGAFIPQMIENGLLTKLNLDLIPNLEHMDPAFLGRAWDPDNEYSICKAWGTTGFVYDKTVITRELKDWNDFLDAAQNEASGKTSVLDDPAELTGIYFWANGIDWNTTDPADLDAAEDYLVNTLAPHVSAFDSYPGGAAIPQATHALMQAWNGDARIGMHRERRARPLAVGARRARTPRSGWTTGRSPSVHRTPRRRTRSSTTCSPPRTRSPSSTTSATTRARTDIEQAADDAGLEMLDLVFFTPEQIATMHEGEVTEAQERIVEIWNAMKAAAGA